MTATNLAELITTEYWSDCIILAKWDITLSPYSATVAVIPCSSKDNLLAVLGSTTPLTNVITLHLKSLKLINLKPSKIKKTVKILAYPTFWYKLFHIYLKAVANEYHRHKKLPNPIPLLNRFLFLTAVLQSDIVSKTNMT